MKDSPASGKANGGRDLKRQKASIQQSSSSSSSSEIFNHYVNWFVLSCRRRLLPSGQQRRLLRRRRPSTRTTQRKQETSQRRAKGEDDGEKERCELEDSPLSKQTPFLPGSPRPSWRRSLQKARKRGRVGGEREMNGEGLSEQKGKGDGTRRPTWSLLFL